MCEHYLVHRDREAAYRHAGYKVSKSKEVTDRNLRQAFHDENVKKYLTENKSKIVEEFIIDVNKIQSELMRIKDLCVGDAKYNEAIRAIELAGKTIGAFIERSESKNVNANFNIPVNEEQVDADLKRIANALQTEKK